MTKPLTQEQVNALLDERGDLVIRKKNYRGLVARGLLAYRWGQSASMGYVITAKGLRYLKEAGL